MRLRQIARHTDQLPHGIPHKFGVHLQGQRQGACKLRAGVVQAPQAQQDERPAAVSHQQPGGIAGFLETRRRRVVQRERRIQVALVLGSAALLPQAARLGNQFGQGVSHAIHTCMAREGEAARAAR